MDNSWFRLQYSPLGKYRAALQERERAYREASAFAQQLLESTTLSNATLSSLSLSGTNTSSFVAKARLGGGSKKSDTNAIPKSHVLTLASQVLPILGVSSYVTDKQLLTALLAHCKQTKLQSSLQQQQQFLLYSSSPAPNVLTRTAYFVCADDAIRKEIIQHLNSIDRGATAAVAPSDTHVPRKEETNIPKTLELIVECSDPYGRMASLFPVATLVRSTKEKHIMHMLDPLHLCPCSMSSHTPCH